MTKAFVTFALACASMNAQIAIPLSSTSAEPANSLGQPDQEVLSTVPIHDAKGENIWLMSSLANMQVHSFSSAALSNISSEGGTNKAGSFGTRPVSVPQVIFRYQSFAIEDAKNPYHYWGPLASIRAPEMGKSRDPLRNEFFVRDSINTSANPSYVDAQAVVTLRFHTGVTTLLRKIL